MNQLSFLLQSWWKLCGQLLSFFSFKENLRRWTKIQLEWSTHFRVLI